MKISYIALAILASLTAQAACGELIDGIEDENTANVPNPTMSLAEEEEEEEDEMTKYENENNDEEEGENSEILLQRDTPAMVATTASSGRYIKIHGHCLAMSPSSKNVYVSPYCGNSSTRKWYFTKGEIRSKYNNWCLGLDTVHGHNVQVQPCDKGTNQKWSYVKLHLLNHYNHKCLDHWHTSSSPHPKWGANQNAHLLTCYNIFDQKWYPSAGFFF